MSGLSRPWFVWVTPFLYHLWSDFSRSTQKFWRGVQLDLTLWNSKMTYSTLECSPGTGPLLCWGRDRTVRNYFVHDLTFPSLCLLLRRKQSFLSDQRGERCSISTPSAKQSHRIGSLLIIQTIWRVKKNLAGCPLHSTHFVRLCPVLLLVEIHLLEPFPTSAPLPRVLWSF